MLTRVARWATSEPVSFLRSNKPSWRIEVTRHGDAPLASDEADAVADSALVLRLLAREGVGTSTRTRRELVLRAMRRVSDGLGLTDAERRSFHHDGYAWAVDLGRWDAEDTAALDRKLARIREGIAGLLALPCDPDSEARWARLVRPPGDAGAALALARSTIRDHANRLGVFAEAEAILHYFLLHLDAGGDPA